MNLTANETGALLRVHRSNFAQLGFVSDVSIEQLCELGLPVIDDVGSGALHAAWDEPVVRRSVEAGAALVCCSGDKLLGGPQAGLLVGWAALYSAGLVLPAYNPVCRNDSCFRPAWSGYKSLLLAADLYLDAGLGACPLGHLAVAGFWATNLAILRAAASAAEAGRAGRAASTRSRFGRLACPRRPRSWCTHLRGSRCAGLD